MTLTDSERARKYVTRRRQRARESGLCIVCCKQEPRQGFATCTRCSASAVARSNRKRRRDRAAFRVQPLIAVYERAGDIASKHNFHAAAAEHYQDALRLSGIDATTQVRLIEKSAEQLWLGNDPVAATALNEGLLATYSRHPELGAKAANTLLRISNEKNIASETQASLALVSQAIRIAELLNDLVLQQRSIVRKANILLQLGRHEEARRCINRIHNIDEMVSDRGERAWYWRVKGSIELYFSPQDEVLAYFDRAIADARNDPDPYRPSTILSAYTLAAWSFGRSDVAKAYSERALLLARRAKVSWLIARRCLEYAGLLAELGELTAAYGYLIEALSVDASAPLLDATVAYIGIPLALHLGDELLLTRCIRPKVVDEAFSRGAPARIGLIAAAFARLYVERGQRRKAHILLHRAVQTVQVIETAWTLPLEVARSGAVSDIPRARSLLEACLPFGRVADAFLRLFNAFVAQRDGRVADCHAAASDAAARFEQFGWRLRADLARSLLPPLERKKATIESSDVELPEVHAILTARERDVAKLILKGLGNRAISLALSLSVNTVEKHVASVLNKFGIRSRYQVAEALVHKH